MYRNIGFDVSETITKYPKQCKMLIDSLRMDSWLCYIVSPNEISSIHKDLKDAGIDENQVIIINRGDKGNVCREYNISIMLDDNKGYLDQCKDLQVMPLQVLRY